MTGPKLTGKRRIVTDYIHASGIPLSALQIAGALAEKMDQATVYRALHHLESHGYIESFPFHCSKSGTVRYYTGITGVHIHYFHCVCCHTFFPFESCDLPPAPHPEERHGCLVHSHTVYYRGICNGCRTSEKFD